MEMEGDGAEGAEQKVMDLVKVLGSRNYSLFKYEGKLELFCKNVSVKQDRESLLPTSRLLNTTFRELVPDFTPN
ncbi:hypothetical protein PGB90_002893 [Kerria lacca]